ncbi:MAG: hypothetical protein P9L97_06140 [Candidatus Tenebribacter davisii]|nr:hypothetical protein [Candidatus Tenebribacter davisii]
MDLIQAIKKVESKDKERNKLLGQREMLMQSLNDLGYENIVQAVKISTELKDEVQKMNVHYQKGEDKFKEQFGHLLN